MQSQRCLFGQRGRVLSPIVVAGVFLCGLWLVLAWAQAPAAQGEGTTHRVPADYDTIQGAINAAQPGDTILVVGKDEAGNHLIYNERLVMTKSLTLRGDVLTGTYEFTETAFAIINAEEGGRAVTILADSDEITVAMRGFLLENGRASGLGGATLIPDTALTLTEPLSATHGVPPSMPTHAGAAASPPAMQVTASVLRQEITRLCNQGAVPGGASACAAMLTQIDWLTAATLDAQQAVTDLPSHPAALLEIRPAGSAGVDCGGGLYSRGAALDLNDVILFRNIASATDSGYGGGVCVVQAPADAVSIRNSTFEQNLASAQGIGYGGGLFVQATTGATISGGDFKGNRAAIVDDGYGGGIALDQAAQSYLGSSANLINNIASAANTGAGGGLFVNRSDGVVVSGIRFFANIAGAGAIGASGVGGGIAVADSDDLVVTESSYFNANVASLGGAGEGGAIKLFKTTNAQIEASIFERNTATQGPLIAYGGAVILEATEHTSLNDNRFYGNVASMFPGAVGGGGALMLYQDTGTRVANNVFHQNVGAANGSGHGGAIIGGYSTELMIDGNEFLSNWAAMLAAETNAGGAVELGATRNVTVTNNSFSLNVGSLYQSGYYNVPTGEGGALVGYNIADTVIATNTFTGNVSAMVGTGYVGSEGVDGGAVAINRGREGMSTRVRIVGNSFTNNTALVDGQGQPSALAAGGAIRLTAIDATVAHNRFESNAVCITNCPDRFSGNGGGMIVAHAIEEEKLTSAQVVIDSNSFRENVAPNGGALLVFGTDGVTLTNNIFAEHRSCQDAVNLSINIVFGDERSGAIVNNTFFANDGSALHLLDWNSTTALVANNVIMSGSVGIDVGDPDMAADLRYNLFNENDVDVHGAIVNTNPITAPVRFVAPELGDFHLMPNSAAIDAGDPAGVPPAPAVDIDGALRPYGPRVDVGAYEWQGQGALLPTIAKE